MKDQEQMHLLNHFGLSLALCCSPPFFPESFYFWQVSLRVISWIILLPRRLSALRGCEPSRESCFWLRCRLRNHENDLALAEKAPLTCSITSFFAVVSRYCRFAFIHLFIHSFILSLTFLCTYLLVQSSTLKNSRDISCIIQLLLDFPFCLKLSTHAKWCISPSQVFFIHYTSNVS